MRKRSLTDWDFVYFGTGSASGVGPEPTRPCRARKLKSVSKAFCDAQERGAPPPSERIAMGFAIPRLQKPEA